MQSGPVAYESSIFPSSPIIGQLSFHSTFAKNVSLPRWCHRGLGFTRIAKNTAYHSPCGVSIRSACPVACIGCPFLET